jgi:long-chain acyl-CoA synthetase
MRETVAKCILDVCKNYKDNAALYIKDEKNEFVEKTYGELLENIKALGTALADLGITRGEHVGIISDNRWEWILTDLALLGLGVVDVPRGSDSTSDEIGFILDHADCKMTFAENKAQLEKIFQNTPKLLKTIIVFDEKDVELGKKNGIEILSIQALLRNGEELLNAKPDFWMTEAEKGTADELATIIYTSGTTGEPKGVILTNRSFTFQLERIYSHLNVKPEHIKLSVLPIWHSFERANEYIFLNRGASIAYSKPVGAVLISDMAKIRPHWMASVPRIWESIRAAIYRNIDKGGGAKAILFHFFVAIAELYYSFENRITSKAPRFNKSYKAMNIALSLLPAAVLWPLKKLGDILVFGKIKQRLGGRFIAGISGGGALPPYVDKFFQAAGVLLLEGYGLTETAPVLAVRKQSYPVYGTVGPLLEDIQHKVLNKKHQEVGPGEKGVLHVKSEQVMQGYYKRQEATDQVLKDGWLDTGDIVVFTQDGEFTILGRAKETIVLSGGENIEPVPIEDKVKQSEFIDHVMVVGQDQKFLGALIVPNEELTTEYAKSKGLTFLDFAELCQDAEIHEKFNSEIQELINQNNGFKHFERIFRFEILPNEFEIDRELTKTIKLKRKVIEKLYKKEIRKIFE